MSCQYHVRVHPNKYEISNGLFDLLALVKPEWDRNKASVELLAGGYINTSWLCCDKDVRLVVRINPDEDTMDRDYEAEVVQHLHDKQLVPKYYGRFQNGMVYEYATGHNPTKAELHRDDVMRLIIDKLYQIHTSGVPRKASYRAAQMAGVVYTDVAHRIHTVPVDQEVMNRLSTEVPEMADLTMSYLREEAVLCRAHMDTMYRKFPHVYCHQDLWRMNIIYDDKQGSVEFIDWEMGDYAPALMDLSLLVDADTREEVWYKYIRLYMERAGIHPDGELVEDWYNYMIYTHTTVDLQCVLLGLWNASDAKDKERQDFWIQMAIENYHDFLKHRRIWPEQKHEERLHS